MNTGTLYKLGWRVLPKVPLPIVYGASNLASTVVYLLNGRSVKQMRKNYRALTGAPVSERTVRWGVRSYFRNFAQQFTMPGWSPQQIRRGCVYPGASQTQKLMEEGPGPVVLALTHTGNWDLAGAWFCQNHGGILTVAEKLEPAELFEEFTDFRAGLGMEIIGVGKGEHVFHKLVEQAKDRPLLVPLLADRDISGRGVEVTLGASKALVAAGPAALALALDRPLIAGTIRFEKVPSTWWKSQPDGRSRRALIPFGKAAEKAVTALFGFWRIHADFTDPIPCPEPGEGESQVEAWTRAWVKRISPALVQDVTDWHMMQKVFVSDLDPERLRRARARASGYDQPHDSSQKQ